MGMVFPAPTVCLFGSLARFKYLRMAVKDYAPVICLDYFTEKKNAC